MTAMSFTMSWTWTLGMASTSAPARTAKSETCTSCTVCWYTAAGSTGVTTMRSSGPTGRSGIGLTTSE
eukprot:scaffold651951_cov45-Prasinocladus_malaysianus.AAC.1